MPLFSLADELVRSREPSLCDAGRLILEQCFLSADPYYRQEVVGAVVAFCSSGVADQIRVGLDVLLALAESESQLQALRPLWHVLKGLLDCVSTLNESHVRMLYRVVAALAVQTVPTGMRRDAAGGSDDRDIDAGVSVSAVALSQSSTLPAEVARSVTAVTAVTAVAVDDETLLLVRKQLSSASDAIRRVGIIGGVALFAAASSSRASAAVLSDIFHLLVSHVDRGKAVAILSVLTII